MSDFPPIQPAAIDEAKLPEQPPEPSGRRWRAELALVGNTFIWGATFVVVKNALADVSTLLFLALRFALAGVTLALLARRTRLTRELVAGSAIVGCALFAGYLFQTLGLHHTTPSKSAFITGFSVVLVPILLALAFRRFAGWGALAGVAAAVVGLYLLTMPAVGAGVNRGDLLTLACAVAFAVHIILIGHYGRRLPAMALAAGQVCVAALLAAVSVPWAEPAFLRLSGGVVFAIVLTGLLATALAFSIQVWAQQHTSPTHTALIFALEPVFAWLTSWVVLGERLGARAAAGAVLILVGIVVAELRGSKT